jgi:hypothetical protein
VFGLAFDLAQAWRPFAARFDATVVPLTRDAFWARLELPDRHEVQADGSIVVRSLLPHLTWGRSSGHARIAAGSDWWSVAALEPALERGRLTFRYHLAPLDASGAPSRPPDERQYQREVKLQVQREWDDVLFAAPWLVTLLPEDVQERAFSHRGGPSAARRATIATILCEVLVAAAFLVRPSALDAATALFFGCDAVRRVMCVYQGRYGPSLLGGLVSDYLRPERRPYNVHREAEREARVRLRSLG